MHYRLAGSNDVDTLAAMNQQLIRDEGHRNPMTLAELTARMRNWLAGEYRAVLFEDDDRAVGYALFRRATDHVYLRQFFIAADIRRQGIGRAALEHLRATYWQDRPRLRVDVLLGNAGGVAFWRAAGFSDYSLTLERPT